MAGRILNRRALRKPIEAVTPVAAPTATTTRAKKRVRAKAPAAPRVKKPRAKKVPPRVCVRWGVFDACVKQVAIFDYNQRAAADRKLAELLGRNKGLYYLNPVKVSMPEPPPAQAITVD